MEALAAQSTNSRTATLMDEIRRTPAFRQLVPQEAGVGWPLPLRRQGTTYLTLPFFGMPPSSGAGSTPLYPPFAAMTLEWRTGRVVAYRHFGFERPWEAPDGPVGTFPHDAVRGLRRSEYLERRADLLALYDQLFERLEQGTAFDDAWAARFSELLGTLMEPGLLPFYRTLAPGFVGRFLGD